MSRWFRLIHLIFRKKDILKINVNIFFALASTRMIHQLRHFIFENVSFSNKNENFQRKRWVYRELTWENGWLHSEIYLLIQHFEYERDVLRFFFYKIWCNHPICKLLYSNRSRQEFNAIYVIFLILFHLIELILINVRIMWLTHGKLNNFFLGRPIACFMYKFFFFKYWSYRCVPIHSHHSMWFVGN